MTWKNALYYGDNLEVYLDPPFNSKSVYNLLFKTENGKEPMSQVDAFNDFWRWNSNAEHTFRELVTQAPQKTANLIRTLRESLGENALMSYIVMMTIRLFELHRVLKKSGSIYLHCDPNASHYLNSNGFNIWSRPVS
jgi:adenine specific DNA methylase Mod